MCAVFVSFINRSSFTLYEPHLDLYRSCVCAIQNWIATTSLITIHCFYTFLICAASALINRITVQTRVYCEIRTRITGQAGVCARTLNKQLRAEQFIPRLIFACEFFLFLFSFLSEINWIFIIISGGDETKAFESTGDDDNHEKSLKHTKHTIFAWGHNLFYFLANTKRQQAPAAPTATAVFKRETKSERNKMFTKRLHTAPAVERVLDARV